MPAENDKPSSRSKWLADRRANFEPPTHSKQFAWLLGALSGGGNVATKGSVRLSSVNSDVVEAFKEQAVAVFNPPRYTHNRAPQREGRPPEYQFSFNDKVISEYLGDMRKHEWAQTIRERHPWVLTDEYAWSFIGGYFDVNGSILASADLSKYALYLGVASDAGAKLLQEILFQRGVLVVREDRHTRKRRDGTSDYRITNVSLTYQSDLRLFAFNVHSNVSKKEEVLNFFRVDITEEEARVLGAYELAKELNQQGVSDAEVLEELHKRGYEGIYRERLYGWLHQNYNPALIRKRAPWEGKIRDYERNESQIKFLKILKSRLNDTHLKKYAERFDTFALSMVQSDVYLQEVSEDEYLFMIRMANDLSSFLDIAYFTNQIQKAITLKRRALLYIERMNPTQIYDEASLEQRVLVLSLVLIRQIEKFELVKNRQELSSWVDKVESVCVKLGFLNELLEIADDSSN